MILNDNNIKKLVNLNTKLKLNLNNTIPYKNKNNKTNKLNEDLDRYKKENKLLKSNLEKYKKENEQLKSNLDKYKIEIDKLKEDLSKSNKIISGIQIIKNNNDEIKDLRDENNKLKYELTIKDNEIKDLKDKLKNNAKDDIKINYKDIMVINFLSVDSSVNCGIKCLPTDIFAEVEEQLYQKFDSLRNTNNMFIVNANPVLRFKKICENNIKDGDVLQLHKLE